MFFFEQQSYHFVLKLVYTFILHSKCDDQFRITNFVADSAFDTFFTTDPLRDMPDLHLISFKLHQKERSKHKASFTPATDTATRGTPQIQAGCCAQPL